MNIKEESSFLQGVESRLDSLFAEDAEPIKDKDSDPPLAAAQEVADELGDLQEIPTPEDTSPKAEFASDTDQTQDKSSFISEIEKRFSAIFGDEEKDNRAVTETEKPVEIKKIIPEAEPEQSITYDQTPKQEEGMSFDQIPSFIPSHASSILDSPLKDMKSIVLSIEWEISDSILEQFEEEINKLYLLYTGDRIIQGFLRILRFLGRYIRVRGVSSNQDSINLLLSAYDHLENVMVSQGMTEARKHIILLENIKKYRSWVENTNLETSTDTQALEPKIEEAEAFQAQPLEDKSIKEQKVEEKPWEGIQAVEEKPFADIAIDKVRDEEPPLREWTQEDKVEVKPFADIQVSKEKALVSDEIDKVSEKEPPREWTAEDKSEYAISEPDILVQAQPIPSTEIPLPAVTDQVNRAIEAMKDMVPHEAFAYALDELKKTFQSELDALKEEIRILKGAR